MVQVRAGAGRMKEEEIPLKDNIDDDRPFRSRPLGSRTTAPPGPMYDELRHDSNQDSFFEAIARRGLARQLLLGSSSFGRNRSISSNGERAG